MKKFSLTRWLIIVTICVLVTPFLTLIINILTGNLLYSESFLNILNSNHVYVFFEKWIAPTISVIFFLYLPIITFLLVLKKIFDFLYKKFDKVWMYFFYKIFSWLLVVNLIIIPVFYFCFQLIVSTYSGRFALPYILPIVIIIIILIEVFTVLISVIITRRNINSNSLRNTVTNNVVVQNTENYNQVKKHKFPKLYFGIFFLINTAILVFLYYVVYYTYPYYFELFNPVSRFILNIYFTFIFYPDFVLDSIFILFVVYILQTSFVIVIYNIFRNKIIYILVLVFYGLVLGLLFINLQNYNNNVMDFCANDNYALEAYSIRVQKALKTFSNSLETDSKECINNVLLGRSGLFNTSVREAKATDICQKISNKNYDSILFFPEERWKKNVYSHLNSIDFCNEFQAEINSVYNQRNRI